MKRMQLTRSIATWLAVLLAGVALAAPPPDDPRYDQAMDLLDHREYGQAYEVFEEYIEAGGSRTDAALYWQARAMYKIGRTDRAIGRLNRLLADYPGSEWRDDAEALMVELRGEAADPDRLDDVHLKIIALQSVMRHDPDRALPMIERMIESSDSEQLREQALFVLGQADTPAARTMLYEYARDTTRPSIARSAIQQIAIFGGAESRRILSDLYDEADDPDVRDAIISSCMINGDTAKLLEIAGSEPDTELRGKAISLLGASGAVRELETLYTPDAPPEVREAVLNAYMIAGETRKLLDVARDDPSPEIREQAVSLLGASGGSAELEELYRTEKDPALRRSLVTAFMVTGDETRMLRIAWEDPDTEIRMEAVQMLGVMGATDELATLRREKPSREVMQAIVTALMISDDAKGLIEIYKTSDDPEIRSMAVQQLSVMDSEDALEFMLEILEED